MSSRIYGIDLGTTYSCISYIDEFSKAVVVPNSEGQQTTPSVVYFESPDNIVVGQAAKEVALLYPDKVISTIKRSVGDENWRFEIAGVEHTPASISSLIVKKLITDAEIVTGEKVTDVVITCPAYFGLAQREITKQVGELAGLKVHHVIPEPTAAAFDYAIAQTTPQIILVFDLGGGTFDVNLIETKEKEITVQCIGGDSQLGGKDWDETLANWFAEEFSHKTGVPAAELTSNLETWQELLKEAENAKITLSSRTSHTKRIRHSTQNAIIEITRDKFDELTAHLLERAISLTEELLETAKNKGFSEVDKLILVGGSTFMPQVKNKVKEKFPFEVLQHDPNQAVAKGAALYGYKCHLEELIKIIVAEETGAKPAEVDLGSVDASVIKSAESSIAESEGMDLTGIQNITATKVTNVTSKSFGIIVNDRILGGIERVQNLIYLNDKVPTKVAKKFSTFDDMQSSVLLKCVENHEPEGLVNETLDPALSAQVGVAELLFKRPLPQDSPLEVTFSLSDDGRLTLYAKDLTTNGEITAEFKTAAILSEKELKEKSKQISLVKVS
ncbi:MAG: Hsp70 family protein [Deltaproteobacteria bacterium]|jgi:molecular chaperone DnaK (HSP70)|nr:Hsp70 family protein [Deltaproteobacteria bacterium]